MIRATCQVGAEGGADEACGRPAPYYSTIDLCSHHAWRAICRGERVTGPTGNACYIDDDEAEIVEEQTAASFSRAVGS